MHAIEIEGVSKRFRKRTIQKGYTTVKTSVVRSAIQGFFTKKALKGNYLQALSGININIKKGSTFGIIGPNGSGKSTLLKLITGIYKPDTGKITINGRVSALIELGAGFHPEFSGRENIFLNGIVLGLSKKLLNKKFDQIVSFADLENFIDDPVRTYSSGMYMRLGFSIAIHVDPDILLIDEVLAVGDEAFIHKCQEKVGDFKRKGKTIVVVTHDLAAIERWCDDVILLDSGKIVERGTSRWVIDRYRQLVAESEEKRLKEEHREAQAEAMKDQDAQPLNLSAQDTAQNEPDRHRWGTREVEIVGVRMIDESGSEKYLFNYGEVAAVEISYLSHKKMPSPVFGIGIFTKDGICCYGSNTHLDRMAIGELPREGKVIFKIKNLDLIDGEYLLDVAVHAEDGYAYDYQTRLYSFGVRSGRADVGIFRPGHEWIIKA